MKVMNDLGTNKIYVSEFLAQGGHRIPFPTHLIDERFYEKVVQTCLSRAKCSFIRNGLTWVYVDFFSALFVKIDDVWKLCVIDDEGYEENLPSCLNSGYSRF